MQPLESSGSASAAAGSRSVGFDAVGSDEGGRILSAVVQNLGQATEAINLTVREDRTVIHDTFENVNRVTLTSGPELQQRLRIRRYARGVRALKQPAVVGDSLGELADVERSPVCQPRAYLFRAFSGATEGSMNAGRFVD